MKIYHIKVTIFFKPKNNNVFHFEILRENFQHPVLFSPFLKMKIRISSHSLIKPPDFILCIFPVAYWSESL